MFGQLSFDEHKSGDAVKTALRVEAHDKAGEEFANALKRTFQGISDHLTEDATTLSTAR
jgi:hypothetical protein